MKIVLTGATGFVGAQVLTELLTRPAITGVTCLTRKIVSTKDPRVRSVVIEDFAAYDEALMSQLGDHSACIWALGGKASDFASASDYERVTHGFTLAFASAFARHTKRASFCYVSGMGADRSESAWLPWERATRHLKGRTERDLATLSEETPGFTSYAFRPAGILPVETNPLVLKLLSPIAVGVAVLARAMVRVAMDGSERRVISNRQIKVIARGG